MPKIILPFSSQGEAGSPQSNMSEGDFYQLLPEALQEACKQNKHLLDYLRLIPVSEIGVPEYYTKLTRAQGDLPQKNLIYRISDNVFVHMYSEPGGGRPIYIPIEPSLTQDMSQVLPEVESNLVVVAGGMSAAESDIERKEAILKLVDRVCVVHRNGSTASSSNAKDSKGSGGNGSKVASKAKVQVTPEQLEAIKYLMVRDKVGMGT
ncbi:MAG: hypothetical protein NTV59_00900, partial [Chloroflexi bacterium]|nr:hypothetical protein [Chloroflexota bacterium]